MIYGYEFDGVYQYDDFYTDTDGKLVLKPGVTQNSRYSTGVKGEPNGARPGAVKYKDQDGDGDITTKDRTVIGNAMPKWFGGITNTFEYKGFDLSFMFQFNYGNDIYNATRLYATQTRSGRRNMLAEVADRWTPTNASNSVPSTKGYITNDVYSRFVEDGSFLRLKNLTLGNLNNPIGVPLTLLRLTTEHELGVVEMGASHPGDIKELVEIAEPDYGIITNVGKAHLEGFGSFEGVIRTKGELYDYLRRQGNSTIFLHQDNPYLREIARGLNPITYGEENSLYINGHVTGNSPYLAFEWRAGKEGEFHQVHTRLIGEYNFPNALAAVTIGHFFGVEAEKIDKALNEYEPRNNRSQLKKTADNTLIIDAYNANPTSMLAAIGNFRNMQAEKKMLILGDMRELGKDSAEEHQRIVDYLEEYGFEDVILVGELFAATRHTYTTYPDAPALIAALQKNKPCGKTILIKGSNGIKLNTVVDYL